MPSPYPGMDPYLEGAEWSSFHFGFTAEIVRQLAPHLAPRYLVRPTHRFITSVQDEVAVVARDIYPDVSVYRAEAATGTVATAAPLLLTTVLIEQEPQYTVEIRDAASRALVTAIEVLSPVNKRGAGYQAYLDKRTRLLYSAAHLLEIDLLRQGQRVPMHEPLPDAPYFIFLSRAERRPVVEAWPVTLADALPTVPVPLLPNDADVPLDLQAVLGAVYEQLRYDLSIDYTRPLDVPLSS